MNINASGCQQEKTAPTPANEPLFEVLSTMNDIHNRAIDVLRSIINRIEGPALNKQTTEEQAGSVSVIPRAFEGRTQAQTILNLAERIATTL